jgi:glycosyltransferase involved in cell wall biosynthesis
MNPVTVVIPVRRGGDPHVTLRTLRDQTFRGFDVVISHDEQLRGQAWALNRGLEKVPTHVPFVLFSDDDIQWEPDALETMLHCLQSHPEAAYCYGSYDIDGRTECDREFNAAYLRRINYISTMSLVRRADCVQFDETLQRFVDWDYWLTLLARGKTGVYCGRRIFVTTVREDGVTRSDVRNTRMRKLTIAQKHGLNVSWLL